ncbi:MAG: FAD-dependent oxidoreductase [Azospirillaceae bacterium]
MARKVTRRGALRTLAALGGSAAVYNGLAALGWLKMPTAAAQELPRFAGLPTEGKSVAVIGAGVAGLTAAYELARAGFSVTVYEADSRYGGRSLTVRPADPAYKEAYLAGEVVPSSFVREDSYVTSYAEVGGEEQVADFVVRDPDNPDAPYPDLYFNAGPGRIPLFHTGVLHYCKAFGVEMEPYIFRSQSNLMRSALLNDGEPVPIRRFGYDLTGYLTEMLAEAAESVTLRPADPMRADELKMFREMLAALGDLTKTPSGELVYIEKNEPKVYNRAGYDVIPYAGPYDGVVPNVLSLEDMVNSGLWDQLANGAAFDWQPSLLEPAGGMDMIWQAFLAQPADPSGTGAPLRDRVRLGAEVVAIDAVEGGARVEVRLASGDAARFDYVVATGSPKYLSQLESATAFSPGIMEDLTEVIYDWGGKYGWQGKSQFWIDENDIFGGISWVDTIIEQIWYPSYGYNAWTGVLTGAYVHNDLFVDINGDPVGEVTEGTRQHATEWGRMSQEERKAAALRGGELLHPGFADKVFQQTGLSIAWQNMPYQWGIDAEFDFTTQQTLYDRLIRPVDRAGRVWLAGDWLSFWPGWQEGSVRSAWYALDQLAAHLRAEAAGQRDAAE